MGWVPTYREPGSVSTWNDKRWDLTHLSMVATVFFQVASTGHFIGAHDGGHD